MGLVTVLLVLELKQGRASQLPGCLWFESYIMAGPNRAFSNSRTLPPGLRDQTNLEESHSVHLHNKPHQVSLENRPHHPHDARQLCRG